MWIRTRSRFRNSSATASYCAIAFSRQVFVPSAAVSRKESRSGFDRRMAVCRDFASGFRSAAFSQCWPKNQPKTSMSRLSFNA